MNKFEKKYQIQIKPELDKKVSKIIKKNKNQYKLILNKIDEISRSNPEHYKNLRKPLQYLKRVHIDKHFVLTFSFDKKYGVIHFEDFNHHDKIYK